MNDHAWLRELLAAGMFTAHGDEIAALLADYDSLRDRLEVTPQGPDGIDARDETIRALEGERDALRADAGKLAAFAYAVMGNWPDVGGLDGFDLQELGEKHGLLEKMTRQAPCSELCRCVEYETGPVECFRLTPIVLAARGMGEAGK